jgi:hypothetical protein
LESFAVSGCFLQNGSVANAASLGESLVDSSQLLRVGEGAEAAERAHRQIACPHTGEIPDEAQDVRMELVQIQELRHPRSAELEPPGQVGSSLNGSGVDEPLKLVCEGQSFNDWRHERFIQLLRTQPLSGLAEVDDEAAQNSPTTDPVGEPREALIS